MKHYAGIGSRRAPKEILKLCFELGNALDEKGYILRSGKAKGCDTAFERGAIFSGRNKPELFESSDAKDWAYEEILKFIPNDRKDFKKWNPYVKGLLARNMMQILGENGDRPVEFVLCWAPSLDYRNSSSGGTGYAIRCALAYNIPTINLFDEEKRKKIIEKFTKIS